jgi:hypothetical protein
MPANLFDLLRRESPNLLVGASIRHVGSSKAVGPVGLGYELGGEKASIRFNTSIIRVITAGPSN